MPEERLKSFKNPPIKEAIFGIAFKDPVDQSKLALFQASDSVKEQFPTVMPAMTLEASADVRTSELKIAHRSDGYQLRSANEKNRLLEIKPTQLTYHNLIQYDGWEKMIGELKGLWSEFCRTVGETQLSQLSVRYINHIQLPLPLPSGFGEYIKLLPQIPEGINPAIHNFFLQLRVPLAENILATITETVLEQSANRENLIFLLDNTVVRTGDFECNESEMWDAFTELRAYKNSLFKSCLTEKTLESFDV